VRIGNAAAGQLQLDVYGEVLDALSFARSENLPHRHATSVEAWSLQEQMLEFLEGAWRAPDDGVWETRGGRQQFVHSKVMCWVAFDRMIHACDSVRPGSPISGLLGEAPVDRWRAARDAIHAEVLDRGFDGSRGTFTQFYGSTELDAAVLQIPLVGFLPATDLRVKGTIATLERELMTDGFVLRYSTGESTGGDGLKGREGAFLACTFWLAQAKVLAGDVSAGRDIFERLLDLRNDVGLLAEEYDPIARRMTGNFPQAFSHVPLIDAALLLDRAEKQQAPVRSSRMRHRS
jgi:GH15 family glucan-1,4-alpha-glucosidase